MWLSLWNILEERRAGVRVWVCGSLWKNKDTIAFKPLYLFSEHHKESLVISVLNFSPFSLAS